MTEEIKCTKLSQSIRENMQVYFDELEGEEPTGIYDMVITQVEKSLICFILERCHNNQTRAAKMLGMSRNALRSRVEKYGLIVKE